MLTNAALLALHAALSQVLAESVDIASALASTHFVEGFLAVVPTRGKQATAVPDLLRELGFVRHARPLLLAFEAALTGKADKAAVKQAKKGTARAPYRSTLPALSCGCLQPRGIDRFQPCIARRHQQFTVTDSMLRAMRPVPAAPSQSQCAPAQAASARAAGCHAACRTAHAPRP